MEKAHSESDKTAAYSELEKSVYSALETYSNVHRGSGHFSMVSTHLFEQAREIILEHLGLEKSDHVVIFSTPRGGAALEAKVSSKKYTSLSSQDIGLPLGVRALVMKKRALPRGAPVLSGGGTTRLISPGWVIWARPPERFEAGTPAIINIIAFARALRLIKQYGSNIFMDSASRKTTVSAMLYHDDLKEYSGRELLIKLRENLIGGSTVVPTLEGYKSFINLDYSASTPTFQVIWKTVTQVWRQPLQARKEIIKEVRSICSKALGAPSASYDVIFTSNTTEAINLAAENLGLKAETDSESIVLSTIFEHSSNDLPWRMVPHASMVRLSMDQEGFLDLNELEMILRNYNQEGKHGRKRIRMVAISGASNVLGIYNDLAEISRIVHRYGAQLLVDAAQMVAHRRIDTEEWDIDYLAFSAHKVYAPFGSGALLVRKGLLTFNSAEMELIHASGEENVAGIAAMGKTLTLLPRAGMNLIWEEEQALTAYALRSLARVDSLQIYGLKDPDSPKLPQKGGVIVFGFKGIMSDRVARELAEQGGIGVRYGCHCAHILVKHLVGVTPLLARFQGLLLTLFPRLTLPGLVRVSLGIGNCEADIDNLVMILKKISRKPVTSKEKISGTANTDIQRLMKAFSMAAAMRVYS